MRTMTVDDFSAHWPEAEKALAEEQEIILTKNDLPVAKLSPLTSQPPAVDRRKRVTPEENRRWHEEIFGQGVVFNDIDELLQKDREERHSEL